MGLLLLEVGFYVFEETVVVVIRLQVADQFIHVCFSGRRKESILFTDASPDILVCGTEIRVEDSESKIEDSEQEGHEDFVWQMRIQGEAQAQRPIPAARKNALVTCPSLSHLSSGFTSPKRER